MWNPIIYSGIANYWVTMDNNTGILGLMYVYSGILKVLKDMYLAQEHMHTLLSSIIWSYERCATF